jgi:hypothetical protein
MKKTIKKIKNLKDGDIFYYDVNMLNEYIDGQGEIDILLSGSDVIDIVDDCSESYDGTILCNGGKWLNFESAEMQVVVIGHYGEIEKFQKDFTFID